MRRQVNLRRPMLGLEWALWTSAPPSSLPAGRPSLSRTSCSSIDAARRRSISRLADITAAEAEKVSGDVTPAHHIVTIRRLGRLHQRHTKTAVFSVRSSTEIACVVLTINRHSCNLGPFYHSYSRQFTTTVGMIHVISLHYWQFQQMTCNLGNLQTISRSDEIFKLRLLRWFPLFGFLLTRPVDKLCSSMFLKYLTPRLLQISFYPSCFVIFVLQAQRESNLLDTWNRTLLGLLC